MANKDNPSGFTAIGPILSSNVYTKGTNAAIYPGDLVKTAADGKIVVASAGSTELMGVALGYAAATATSILVADDPDQQYYVQITGTTGGNQTDVTRNIDILATAGSATFLKSQHEADSGAATLATANLRILAIHPNDTVGGANARIRVVVNEHSFAKKTAGI